ncbi:MAG: glycosyltransferase [Candidatus Eisenbacteria bacterium]|nr:glycosyltransferase [Candidatus Eisenbacteria bacterium]
MPRRRVLVLCYFFPPLAGGGVHRVLSFTRHLPDHGWDCTVVCAGEGDYWVTDHSLTAGVRPETEVIRVRGGSALSVLLHVTRDARGKRSGRAFAGLRRWSDWWLLPDSYTGWANRARAAAARRIAAGGIDALISSSPPDSVHLAARSLARRFAIPWAADFRDPWIGLSFRDPPTAWHRGRQAAMERSVLDQADAVMVASDTHRRWLRRSSGTTPDPARVHLLPNGFEASPPVASPATPAGERFQIVFTGTLSLMPDTEVFLEAIHEALKHHPRARRSLRARLIGPYDSGYADRAVALGLTGIVEFTGPLAHAESRRQQREASLLVLWKPRGAPTMVPGKLYEYLDAGRPLLAALEPEDEAAELVLRAGGARVAPGDRDAMTTAIEERWLAWQRGERPADARPAWLDRYRRAELAGDLARILDSLKRERA